MYLVDYKITFDKYDEILNIVEKRALIYDIWKLWHSVIELITTILEENNRHFKEDIKKFPNIIAVLSNEKDPHFRKLYIEEFEKIICR